MVAGASKILTVSYGTFSCTLEGFDEPFVMMKAIAEYFRDLAAEDRYFGAEPPQPDGEALQRLASREARGRVEARVDATGLTLRAAPLEPGAADAAPAQIDQEVAAKLDRIRRAVAEARNPIIGGDRWPGMVHEVAASTPPETAFPLPDAEPADRETDRPEEDFLPLLLETSLPGEGAIEDAESPDISAEAVAGPAPAAVIADPVSHEAPPAAKAVEMGEGRNDAGGKTAHTKPLTMPVFAMEEDPDPAPAELASPAEDAMGTGSVASGIPAETGENAHVQDDLTAENGAPDNTVVADRTDMPALPEDASEEWPVAARDLPSPAKVPQEETLMADFSPQEECIRREDDTIDAAQPLPGAQGTEAADPQKDNLRRLFDATGEHLPHNDSQRHISAVAQLRAALAATIAEHLSLGRRKAAEPEAAPESRPAPLVLVTAQRVDPTAEADRRADIPEAHALPGAIHPQPIRVARTEPQLSSTFHSSDPPSDPAMAQNFARFARSHGSHGLDDLLEAAAAYIAQIEGHSHFSPPDIMHKLSDVADEGEFTPEERLRVFGRLLRQGKIAKIRPGQYTITEASRFYQKRA